MGPDPGAQPVTQTSGRTLIDYLKEYLARPDVVEQMKQVEAAFVELSKVYGGLFQMMWMVMIDYLKEYLARPDVVEQMKPVEGAFIGLLKVYGGMFQMMGTLMQRAVESSYLARPDVVKRMKPWQTACDGLLRAFSGLSEQTGSMCERERKASSRRRYNPVPCQARPWSASDPSQGRGSACSWEETSIIETIFDDASLTESEFIGLLRSVVEGREVVWRRITEIAAAVAPHLSVPRGLKVSKASATHEFFLEIIGELLATRAYTWNQILGKCTDSVTEATRREFANSNFDPRPAYRRLKSRRIVKIS